jgi:SAM-dependent methyltransferase
MEKSENLAKERLSEEVWMPKWTISEHLERYNFTAKFLSRKHVIDCATGSGVGASIFLKERPLSFIGYDIDETAINIAKSKNPCGNTVFEKADALHLPSKDASADIFISLETVEHVADDKSFIEEIARVLRPGGILICSTPNRLVTNPGSTINDQPWNKYHVREYSPIEFIKLLETKFIIEGWYGQNRNNRWKVLITRIVARIFGKLIAVRMNQMWKCRWYFFTDKSIHVVKKSEPSLCDEYMIAVCRLKPGI